MWGEASEGHAGGRAPEAGDGAAPTFPSTAVPLSPGGHHKPSLSVWPSPVVPLGGHVTLKCQFPLPFATFKLFRRKGTRGRELQRRRSKSFTIDPVSVAHAGFYACSVALCHSCEWSARSDPLQIVVTGRCPAPPVTALRADGPARAREPRSGGRTEGHRA